MKTLLRAEVENATTLRQSTIKCSVNLELLYKCSTIVEQGQIP